MKRSKYATMYCETNDWTAVPRPSTRVVRDTKDEEDKDDNATHKTVLHI